MYLYVQDYFAFLYEIVFLQIHIQYTTIIISYNISISSLIVVIIGYIYYIIITKSKIE